MIIAIYNCVSFSDIFNLFTTEDTDQILLQIMFQQKEIEMLRILKILADLLCIWGKINPEKRNKFAGKLNFIDKSIWSKFTPLGTNITNLKLVVEIFYHMANFRIIDEMPTLLKMVKGFWQDEELLHGTVRLVAKLWVFLLHDGLLNHRTPEFEMETLSNNTYYLSVLMRISFDKYPNSFEKTINFPRNCAAPENKAFPLIREWLETLLANLGKRARVQKLLKAIRPIMPIVSGTIKCIYEKSDLAATYGSDNYLLTIMRALNLIFLQQKDPEINFKVIIESKIMSNLMDVFEKYPPEIIFQSSEFVDDDDDDDTSLFFLTVERFLRLHSRAIIPTTLQEKHNILNTLLKILKCEKFYERETLKFHSKTARQTPLPFMPGERFKHLEIVYKDDLIAGVFFENYCNSELNIVSTLIAHAEKHEHAVHDISTRLRTIVNHCKSPELVDLVLPFLRLGYERSGYKFDMWSQDLDRCYDESGRSQMVLSMSYPCATLDVIHFIVEHSTFARLKEIETEYDFIWFILRVIGLTTDHEHVGDAFQIILSLMDKHDFKILSPEVIVDQMPLILRRKNLDRLADKCAREITVKLAFSLMSSPSYDSLYEKLQNLPDFEPTLNDYVKDQWCMVPHRPDAIGLMWLMVKSGKCRGVVETFSIMESHALEKTVGYLDFGNTEIARILKLLADEIIMYLVRDPPYNARYLIDLTNCMVVIARSCSLDEELYVLEDMVSPAMWLLEKQDDEKIVANVKEFIKILH